LFRGEELALDQTNLRLTIVEHSHKGGRTCRGSILPFALAGGIYGAGCVALATICALLGIPGFKPFADLLVQFYGFYGYSVSSIGTVIGAFWDLLEGFVHFGIFALLYNLLLGRS
jgi:hypothetical protein